MLFKKFDVRVILEACFDKLYRKSEQKLLLIHLVAITGVADWTENLFRIIFEWEKYFENSRKTQMVTTEAVYIQVKQLFFMYKITRIHTSKAFIPLLTVFPYVWNNLKRQRRKKLRGAESVISSSLLVCFPKNPHDTLMPNACSIQGLL